VNANIAWSINCLHYHSFCLKCPSVEVIGHMHHPSVAMSITLCIKCSTDTTSVRRWSQMLPTPHIWLCCRLCKCHGVYTILVNVIIIVKTWGYQLLKTGHLLIWQCRTSRSIFSCKEQRIVWCASDQSQQSSSQLVSQCACQPYCEPTYFHPRLHCQLLVLPLWRVYLQCWQWRIFNWNHKLKQ